MPVIAGIRLQGYHYTSSSSSSTSSSSTSATTILTAVARSLTSSLPSLSSPIILALPSGIDVPATSHSRLLSSASSTTTASHSATKDILIIVGIILLGVLGLCLLFAIASRIVGGHLRWKHNARHKTSIDLHTTPLRLPTHLDSTELLPSVVSGNSLSTLFTTRRKVPCVEDCHTRRPIEASSHTSSRRSPPHGHVDRDHHNRHPSRQDSTGNLSPSSTINGVRQWMTNRVADHAEHLTPGLWRQRSLQSLLYPLPYSDQIAPRHNQDGSLLLVNMPCTNQLPMHVQDSRGNATYDVARSFSQHKHPLPTRSKPENRVQAWRADLPSFVDTGDTDASQFRHPSSLDTQLAGDHLCHQEGNIAVAYARQTSYDHNLVLQTKSLGAAPHRPRQTSQHLQPSASEGPRRRSVSQRRLIKEAPRVVVTSASPLVDTAGPSRRDDRFIKGKDGLAQAAEMTIAIEPACSTLRRGNVLLPPALLSKSRAAKVADFSDRSDEKMKISARSGTSAENPSTDPPGIDAASTASLSPSSSDGSLPSFAAHLSSSLLAALSPQLPESGAAYCDAFAIQPCSSRISTTDSEEGRAEPRELQSTAEQDGTEGQRRTDSCLQHRSDDTIGPIRSARMSSYAESTVAATHCASVATSDLARISYHDEEKELLSLPSGTSRRTFDINAAQYNHPKLNPPSAPMASCLRAKPVVTSPSLHHMRKADF